MLKALVVIPNSKTSELGDLLFIARAEAKKREHTNQNIPIKTLTYVPELGIYVAVYEWCSNPQSCMRKEKNET